MFKWVTLVFGLVAAALMVTYHVLGEAGAARPARLAVAFTGAGVVAVWAILWVIHKVAGQGDNTGRPDPGDSRPTS